MSDVDGLQGGSGFRPMRQGQQVDAANVADEQQTQTTAAFTRKNQQQSQQKSIFPDWDLLPPRSIIRRRGQS